MDPEIVQDGIKIMEEFFKAWSSNESKDQEDIVMEDVDSPSDIHLEDLQRHIHDFRSRIELNPWLQSVIQSF
jgi:hypothetical protein